MLLAGVLYSTSSYIFLFYSQIWDNQPIFGAYVDIGSDLSNFLLKSITVLSHYVHLS